MKSTENFKEVIQEYLDQRAKEDSLFAVSYAKENKNIDDCINYILNTVQKSGCNGFTDNEIFSMAVHYYDEDNIEVGKPIKAQVVSNRTVELTEDDIKEAKTKAMQAEIEKQRESLSKRPKRSKEPKVVQTSLFDRP